MSVVRCRRQGSSRSGSLPNKHTSEQRTHRHRPRKRATDSAPNGRVGPHADRVDGKRGVERPVADGQALDRRVHQAYPSGSLWRACCGDRPGRSSPASGRCRRPIPGGHSGSQCGDGHARTTAEFDDAVGQLDVEKLHRPAVARHVRRAPAHDPAGSSQLCAAKPRQPVWRQIWLRALGYGRCVATQIPALNGAQMGYRGWGV